MSTILLGGVTLPDDLQWTDEHAWSPVMRSSDYGITGGLLIQESTKLAGRPITYAGEWAWIDTTTLAALQALNAIPKWEGTLVTADGREFTVGFRGTGIEATPVFFEAPNGAMGGQWRVTIYLQTV